MATDPRAGLLLVAKPSGPTSHDVVARTRFVLGTKKVGHAGTLDPMASGLLILGVERATKLLGHLALNDKSYRATIRLGESTSTEDAEGELIATVDASGVTDQQIRTAMATLSGDIWQVPSSVSAIKVDGRRAYDLVRAGESVVLAARPVTVNTFDLLSRSTVGPVIELEVLVDCSTGTYVRALARDLGGLLGVGAHLTALRRTRIGPFDLADAVDIYADQPWVPRNRQVKPPRSALDPAVRAATWSAVLPAVQAAARSFPVRRATVAEATDLSFGRSVGTAGIDGTYAVVDSNGTDLLALVAEADGRAKPVLVWYSAS